MRTKTQNGFIKLSKLVIAVLILVFVCDASRGAHAGYSYINDEGRVNRQKLYALGDDTRRHFEGALACVKEGMSDLEIALSLHDYLVLLNNYPDLSDAPIEGQSQTPAEYEQETITAILGQRSGVCTSYAYVYKMLLTEFGIPSELARSEKMNHIWNVVKIDGTYYHVDCTWDDPTFNQGLTSHGDINADLWDEGYVRHDYFMKSDEEIAALEHFGWTASETPKADKSGTFDSFAFAGANAAMYYRDGLWYYLNATTGRVEVSDIKGNSSTKIDFNEYPQEWGTLKYMHMSGDALYFSTDSRIFRTDLNSENPEGIYNAHKAEIISEFSIVGGSLLFVIIDDALKTTRHEMEMSGLVKVKQSKNEVLSWIIAATFAAIVTGSCLLLICHKRKE